jgi:hypothetical protein
MGIFLAFFLVFMACSDDDGDIADVNCGESWFASQRVQDELNEYNNAFSAYTMNPTVENCDALKDAANAYVDTLESFRSCAVDQGTLDQWQESVDDIRESIDNAC